MQYEMCTVQVSRPLFATFQHDRCRAHKMLVGHRPVAIFRTAGIPRDFVILIALLSPIRR